MVCDWIVSWLKILRGRDWKKQSETGINFKLMLSIYLIVLYLFAPSRAITC
jgi:hypothetical protein